MRAMLIPIPIPCGWGKKWRDTKKVITSLSPVQTCSCWSRWQSRILAWFLKVPVGSKLRKMDEEEVHIAVGKNSRKEKANILWTAANFPRATIVLVHVHWPSKWMPFSKIFIIFQANPFQSLPCKAAIHSFGYFSVMLNMAIQPNILERIKNYWLIEGDD